MHQIIYIVGAVVVVIAILSFVGLARAQAAQPRNISMISEPQPPRRITPDTSTIC